MSLGNNNPQKYLILNRIAQDPDMSAAEAARTFGVNRHTIGAWCKESGISLGNHKKPRVGFILNMKKRKIKRLLSELAVLEKEIRALQAQDLSAPYTKPKKGRK